MDAPAAQPGLKRFLAGTHRTASPDETLEWIAPLARRVGITRVANITGLDVIGVPVVAVIRPNSRSIAVAQGKGLTLAAAKVSGLMESIENYHAEHVQAPLLLANWREMLRRGDTIDLNGLPRVQGSTFSDGVKMLWIEGHGIMARKPLWVPFEIVHANYTLPLATGSGAFVMSDSGVASGNHPLEATSHGICELVERDAVTLWAHSGERERAAQRIRLDEIDDDPCRDLLERFARAGVSVAVWNVTSDIGIPAFFCTIVDREPRGLRSPRPASGAGCHPSRAVALVRALTEAAQTRLTMIAGSRDDIGIATYRRQEDRALLDSTLRMMNAAAPAFMFSDVPTHVGGTLEDDIDWELGRLACAGLAEACVVDLTSPELHIPVVRVVIPGLEGIHDAPGFIPGVRLRRRLK
jgi:YcaO-like protein with predicted kinase domain